MNFEEQFFGRGNRISWQSIRDGTLPTQAAARLAPFLNGFREGRDISVLPRVTPSKESQWYFLCASERHARLARDLARAFLGPSYSDLDQHPVALDPNDPIDAVVMREYRGSAFRITVTDQDLVDQVRERLHRLLDLRIEQPVRDIYRIRPIGRILRDFEFALLARDETTAEALISEARNAGYLSAANLAFLDVLRLASVENWRAILALPQLVSLLAVQRPRRVTEALIRAVYAVHLRSLEDPARVSEALDCMKNDVLPHYGSLYRSRALLSGFTVDASFALVAAVERPPGHRAIHEIQEEYGRGSSERAYIDAIAAFVAAAPAAIPHPSLQRARGAYAEGDVDGAFAMAISLSPSFERTGLLLICASEMGTLTASRHALDAEAALPPAERQRLAENAVLWRIRKSLQELASDGHERRVPESWPQWLARLGDTEVWKGATSVAEAGAREWSVEEFARDASAVETLADQLLRDRPAWAKAPLMDSLPHLLRFFERQGIDGRFRPVYDSLFALLATDPDISLPQVSALVDVVQARFGLGVTEIQYAECLSVLTDAFQRVATYAIASVALDAVESLVGTACPLPDARKAFVGTTAALFQRWSRWIPVSTWLLLKELGEELDVQLNTPQQPTVESSLSDEWAALNGKKISLYSLNESALRRATSVIGQLAPNASTQFFHDVTGGSNALRTAARTADVFIVATGSATHAATGFIDANRPPSATTLRTTGKGSSSLVGVLHAYLQHKAE